MVDITTEQVLPFTFQVKDGRGRTVATDGTPVAASSDETVGTVGTLTSADGKVWAGELNSVAPSPPDTTQRITVSADADLGQGIQEVTGVLDFTVSLDPRTAARIVDIQAGTPTDKPV